MEQELKRLEAEEERLKREIGENPTDYALLNQNCAQLEEVKAQYEAQLEKWMELDEKNEN